MTFEASFPVDPAACIEIGPVSLVLDPEFFELNDIPKDSVPVVKAISREDDSLIVEFEVVPEVADVLRKGAL